METRENLNDCRDRERPLWNRRELLRRAGTVGASGVLLGPAVLSEILGRPASAFSLVPKPSVDQQKKLGGDAAKQILQKYKEVHDKRASFFNRIGQKLVAALPADDRKWNFSFHVLDSKEINAFALPGGPMFMFTGLYEKLDTVDALAAVTGHEMTHVRKEHWAKAYQKEQERHLGLGLLLGLTKAGNLAQTAASLADNLVGLKYSRGEEDEADDGGLQDLVAAGYNPNGMLSLFETLQKVSGNGGGGLAGNLLSDHPLTSERIDHTKNRIAALKDSHPTFPALQPLNYKALV